MYKLATFVSALGLFAQSASAQGLPVELPQITGAGSGGDSNCGGCFVVADVAGVAFGTSTLSAVQTNSVIVQQGRNGTTFTTTSVVLNQAQFTVAPTGLAAAPAPTGGLAFNTDGTTAIVSGVTLTSPTAYEVFTAFTVTSSFVTNGVCSTAVGSVSNLATAFSVAIPSGSDLLNFQIEAERSFVSFIGLPSCSPSVGSFQTTTQIPVNITTTATTVTATGRATLMPVSVAASRTSPAGPTAPVTTSFAAVPNNGSVPLGTAGLPTSRTIMVAGASRLNTVGSWVAGVAALLAGIVA